MRKLFVFFILGVLALTLLHTQWVTPKREAKMQRLDTEYAQLLPGSKSPATVVQGLSVYKKLGLKVTYGNKVGHTPTTLLLQIIFPWDDTSYYTETQHGWFITVTGTASCLGNFTNLTADLAIKEGRSWKFIGSEPLGDGKVNFYNQNGVKEFDVGGTTVVLKFLITTSTSCTTSIEIK